MIILSVYRDVLIADRGISDLAGNRVYFEVVDQNALRPNILLQMPEQGQDYAHDGPVGLMDAHLKVTCRADSPDEVIVLGDRVFEFLQVWQGTVRNHEVQLTEHFNTRSGFEPKAGVYTHLSEYTSFFRKV